MKKTKDPYFEAAQNWHYDRYQATLVNSNRWFMAFIVSMLLCIGLVAALSFLLPLKTLVPMLVHTNAATGEVFVTKPKNPYVPANEAQVQADIVQYVTHRESYTFADLNQRYHVVMLKSDKHSAKEYADAQSERYKDSPINLLGEHGKRTVKIEDIVFIDNAASTDIHHFDKPAHNLAKVDFKTQTQDKDGHTVTQYWVATLAWVYLGTPDNQSDAWDNWNGFTVTSYRVDPRHI